MEPPLNGVGRRDQMYASLSQDEILRTARFGAKRLYQVDDMLIRTGSGLFVVISGRVRITRHDATQREVLVVDHAAGSVFGETAILIGRQALVDAVASEPTEVVELDPAGLRALLTAVNRRLMTTQAREAGAQSRAMLIRWGKLHSRSVLGAATTLVFAWALAG